MSADCAAGCECRTGEAPPRKPCQPWCDSSQNPNAGCDCQPPDPEPDVAGLDAVFGIPITVDPSMEPGTFRLVIGPRK